LSSTIASAAMPTLSFISGYLAFGSFSKKGYLNTLQGKLRTLLAPLLFWNIVFLLFALYLHGLQIDIRPDLNLGSMGVGDVADALLGIARLPINAPLYFLRELIICFALLPLTHLALQRTLTSIALLALLAVATLLLYSIPGVFRIDIYFWFIAGYALASKDILLVTRKGLFQMLFAVALFVLCAATITLLGFSSLKSLYPYAQKAANLFGPAVFLICARGLSETPLSRPLRWASKYSFTLFLVHTVAFVPLRHMRYNSWVGLS
jgi:succinoglycan biosynthesis protein ExoH